MKVTLKVVSGREKGLSFQFTEADSFLIGRSPKAHLQLHARADRFISRFHCLLEIRPPRCILTDLDSTNGTFVNDGKVQQEDLKSGDIIRAGETDIQVGIEAVKGRGVISVMCSECGKEVKAGADIQDPDDLEFLTFICSACRKAREPKETRKVQPQRAPSVAARDMPRCSSCGSPVPSTDQPSGMEEEGVEVSYLCPGCIKRQGRAFGGPRELGNYLILDELGRGGMGVVFKGVEKATGKLCAIKQILPEIAREERARRLFEREIEIQSTVMHPNLVRVWERARDAKALLYFITEYLPGGDMEALITDVYEGPVDPPVACRFIIQILRGVQALHECGMIHRDLKPGNFLLTRPHADRQCVAKVTDYGFAKCFEAAGNSVFEYTTGDQTAGSPMYMPPEQITNYRFVKPPCDTYAVGVSLYLLLSAWYPVDYPTPLEEREGLVSGQRRRNPLRVILNDPPIPLLERHPGLPQELALVVDKAVCKEESNRYLSASEFRGDLSQVAGALGWLG